MRYILAPSSLAGRGLGVGFLYLITSGSAVIIHFQLQNWLVLIEAVTSHSPIDAKRKTELKTLFKNSQIPLVMVTAFLNRKAMKEYLPDISWETDVWVAEDATHLIHFNGEHLLQSYQ